MIEDSREKVRALVANAVDFHGHLGPFLVLGLRMGVIARHMLKPEGRNEMAVTMYLASNPPVSCTVDGVQVSSGCTIGKNTIRISEASDQVAGEFRVADRVCTIALKSQIVKSLLKHIGGAGEQGTLELAEDVMSRPDVDLFDVSSVP